MKKPPGELSLPSGLPNTKEVDIGILKPYHVPHSPHQGMTTTDQTNRRFFFTHSSHRYAVCWALARAAFDLDNPKASGITTETLNCCIHLLGLVENQLTGRQLSLRQLEREDCWSKKFIRQCIALLCSARLLQVEKSGFSGADTFFIGDGFNSSHYLRHLERHKANKSTGVMTWPLRSSSRSASKFAKQLRAEMARLNQTPSEEATRKLDPGSSADPGYKPDPGSVEDPTPLGSVEDPTPGSVEDPTPGSAEDPTKRLLDTQKKKTSLEKELEEKDQATESRPSCPSVRTAMHQILNSVGQQTSTVRLEQQHIVEPASIEQSSSSSSTNELQEGDLVLLNDQEHLVIQKDGWQKTLWQVKSLTSDKWTTVERSKLKLLKKAQLLSAPD